MASSVFNRPVIHAISCCVPPSVRRLDDKIDLFGGNPLQIARIKQTIGLDEIRVVDDGVTAVDLCGAAARHCLSASGLELSAVDALIFVTQTPDYSQPCNAAVTHCLLGLPKSCAAFDVNLGCSGYVYGLWLAYSLIEGGGLKNVLLLAGDTLSRVVNPRDRSTAVLFGDAGTATLVTAGKADSRSWFRLHTDGTGYRHLIVPASGARQPPLSIPAEEVIDGEGNVRTPHNLSMNGAEVFNFSIKEEPPAIRELLQFAGVGIAELDGIVFHQANRYIISNIARRIGLPLEKAPCDTVRKYGNQSSASIPVTLCDAYGAKLCQPDHKLKLALSGFGVGLSWASGLLMIGGLASAKVFDHNR